MYEAPIIHVQFYVCVFLFVSRLTRVTTLYCGPLNAFGIGRIEDRATAKLHVGTLPYVINLCNRDIQATPVAGTYLCTPDLTP